ncbi:MAG: helix-turn-helix transcriptional regulator, partial [Coriobacteriales bacterium]|nr:helix-turn-helix transcriptional regulator [Coriobacteriales bacterium]
MPFLERIVRPSFVNVFGFGCDRFISIQMFSIVVALLNRPTVPTVAFIICALSVLVALGALLLVGAKAHQLSNRVTPTHLVVACMAAIVCGIVLQQASWAQGALNLVVFSVSMLFLSVGSALVLLQWGTVFGSVGSKMMLVEVSAGYLIAMAMAVPYNLLPTSLKVAYLVLATLINGLLLVRSLRRTEADKGDEDGNFEAAETPVSVYRSKLVTRICGGLFFCGAGIGLSSVIFRFAENALSIEGSVLRLIGGAVVMVVAICIAVCFRKGLVVAEYRFTYLVAVMGTLLSLVLPPDSPINTVVLFTTSTSIMIVGATILLGLAHRRLYHPAQVVSVGVASIIAGNLVVRCLLTALDSLQGAPELPYTVLVVILVALFVIADCLFLGMRLSLGFESDADIDPRAKAQSDEIIRQSRIVTFEEDVGLTQREQEVFRLLIAGRSSRRIQEELFISESTANTHI